MSAVRERSSNTTTYHELVDGFLVELSDEGGRSIDQLRTMYDRHRIPNPDRGPDIRCELTDEEPDPDAVLGWPKSHYGRDGDQFVISRRGRFLTVDEDWSHISMSPDWEPYHAVYVIEFEIRRRMAQAGWALLHGCGFRYNGQTILCPSIRGAGKTNTLLAVLQDGGSYLSDDRVWVNGRGTVRGYPLPINPHTEQYLSFPELTDPDTSLSTRASKLIEDHLDPKRSILDKGISFLSSELLDEDDRSFRDINDLMPDASYVSEDDIDRVSLLRADPKHPQISVEAITAGALSRALTMIHHYEWNGQLTEYFLAFDALFPEGEKSRQIDDVRTAELGIFNELLGSVPTNLVKVPRETNWKETGVSEDILRAFESLTESATQPA